jgi:hypothetical protein
VLAVDASRPETLRAGIHRGFPTESATYKRSVTVICLRHSPSNLSTQNIEDECSHAWPQVQSMLSSSYLHYGISGSTLVHADSAIPSSISFARPTLPASFRLFETATMSGLEIVGVVLGLYPIVKSAVEAYREAKSGLAVRSLARQLNTQATIYEQFVRRLVSPNLTDSQVKRLLLSDSTGVATVAWQEDSLHKTVRVRLGDGTCDLILEHLKECDKLLRTLKGELSNLARRTVRAQF